MRARGCFRLRYGDKRLSAQVTERLIRGVILIAVGAGEQTVSFVKDRNLTSSISRNGYNSIGANFVNKSVCSRVINEQFMGHERSRIRKKWFHE